MRRRLLLAATLAGLVGSATVGCQWAAGVALDGEITKKHTAVIERAATGVQRGYPSFAVSELARWESDLKKYKEREDDQELGTGLAVP